MMNRRVTLASRPVGIPQLAHFALDSVPVPASGGGELLVENIYLSVDPAQRGYVNDEASYAPPVPLGAVMRSLAIGRVIESQDPGFAPGEHLYGWFGWQEYCVCRADAVLRRVDPAQAPLSTAAGLLGINGLTALIALREIGRPRQGETVVVTAAAGAVGSIAGQLARRQGCRTVAVVGSDAKGAQCVKDFGYADFVNYHGQLGEGLRSACPRGIDVFFDNVAGPVADTIVRHMAWFGRIIQCGTISIPSWASVPQGPRIEREILTRRLAMQGFVIFDHQVQFDAVAGELAALLAEGVLHIEEDIEVGIERAPHALLDVYSGRNRGKKLIHLER